MKYKCKMPMMPWKLIAVSGMIWKYLQGQEWLLLSMTKKKFVTHQQLKQFGEDLLSALTNELVNWSPC